MQRRRSNREEIKLLNVQKRKPTFTGDAHHSLRHWTDAMLPARGAVDNPSDDVFADTSWTLYGKAESKGEEEQVVAAPAAKKHHASNPYRLSCCRTLLFSSLHHNYPKDLPRAQCYSSRSGFHVQCEEFLTYVTYDLVDVNGGLWYGVPIFTFWRDQVDKGSIPEPDMEHNYIRLYKTHKDTFQIMLTPKPK